MSHQLSAQATHMAHQFRLGLALETSLKLADLIAEAVTQSAGWTALQRHALILLTQQILAHQEAEDWLGLADCLEYELTELLTGSW